MRYLVSSIFFSLLFFSNVAFASPAVEQMQKHYRNVSTMQAGFTQILFHKESGSMEERKGLFSFKKPLLVAWEITSPDKEFLIVNKEAVWNAFPDEKLAFKYPVRIAEDSRNFISVITGQSKIGEEFTIESSTTEGNLTKLHLYPNEPIQSLIEAFLWIDSIGLVKKVKIIDFYGNTNEITFLEHKVGVSISDTTFSYTLPSDFTLEDHTNADASEVLLY